METGKQMITGIMVKANKVKQVFNAFAHARPTLTLQWSVLTISCIPLNKSAKAFLESYEDMLLYTQREETWPVTQMELDGRGVSIAECIPAT